MLHCRYYIHGQDCWLVHGQCEPDTLLLLSLPDKLQSLFLYPLEKETAKDVVQDLQGIRQGFDLHILDLNQSVIHDNLLDPFLG